MADDELTPAERAAVIRHAAIERLGQRLPTRRRSQPVRALAHEITDAVAANA